MQTQDTKNWQKMVISFAALLAILFPLLGEAGPMGKAGPHIGLPVGKNCLSVRDRPLSDFLNAQGTLNDPPLFFPPVKDYAGWADAVDPNTQLPTIFALVDYAGLANKYIKAQTGHALGTNVRGLVLECKLAGGKAQITVSLFTTKALGFAQSITELAGNGFDFLNTPTIFGAKAQDVASGVDAAVGPVALLATFSIPAPNAPLPDFLAVINETDINGKLTYGPVTLDIVSATQGPVSDPRCLKVHQVASTSPNGKNLIFSTEIVNIEPAPCHE